MFHILELSLLELADNRNNLGQASVDFSAGDPFGI